MFEFCAGYCKFGVGCLVFGGFCCNADSGLLAGCGFSPGLCGVLVLLVLWGFL